MQWLKMGALEWSWPIVFASMVHLLWIDRNHFVFSSRSVVPDLLIPKVIGQVAAIHTHLRKPSPSFIEASCAIEVRWTSSYGCDEA